MHFVIDESSWDFRGATGDTVEELEQLLDLIERVADDGETVSYCGELFYQHVLDGRSLYDLYAADAPIHIPIDVQQRIASIFARLARWDDDVLPPSLDVVVAGRTVFAPSLAWAHVRAGDRALEPTAALVFGLRRASGQQPVELQGVAEDLWLIAREQDRRGFYRWVIVARTTRADELAALAGRAFPSLDFVENVFNGFKDFSKPYRDMVATTTAHLAALDDHGQRIFKGQWREADAHFGPLGVDISDENGRAKSDRQAKAERTLTWKGESYTFWWHTKIERHQDRIHILPDFVPTGGRIVVGRLHKHLYLPGD